MRTKLHKLFTSDDNMELQKAKENDDDYNKI
jgi:hypothetical protein